MLIAILALAAVGLFGLAVFKPIKSIFIERKSKAKLEKAKPPAETLPDKVEAAYKASVTGAQKTVEKSTELGRKTRDKIS